MKDSAELIRQRVRTIFASTARGPAGIWTLRNTVIGIGAVLFAQRGNKIIVVEKAAVNDYEFSGLLALPGGMVRSSSTYSKLECAIERGLVQRVKAECGVTEEHLLGVRAFTFPAPPVSCYTAKGGRRHTVVLAFQCDISNEAELNTADKSIRAATWIDLPIPWPKFAPANQLIIASAIWRNLSNSQKKNCVRETTEAVDRCNAWADEIHFPRFIPPWKK